MRNESSDTVEIVAVDDESTLSRQYSAISIGNDFASEQIETTAHESIPNRQYHTESTVISPPFLSSKPADAVDIVVNDDSIVNRQYQSISTVNSPPFLSSKPADAVDIVVDDDSIVNRQYQSISTVNSPPFLSSKPADAVDIVFDDDSIVNRQYQSISTVNSPPVMAHDKLDEEIANRPYQSISISASDPISNRGYSAISISEPSVLPPSKTPILPKLSLSIEDNNKFVHEDQAPLPDDDTYYWDNRLQSVLNDYNPDDMAKLGSDFSFTACLYGQIIINEKFLPLERKTIKPVKLSGVAGGMKFIVKGILYKFAADFNNIYGSDEYSAKAAGHDLKSLSSIVQCKVQGIKFPLMTLIDFRGFRLQALSLLPIKGHDSLIYGSLDGGRSVVNKDPIFYAKMKQIGRLLNLKEHTVHGVSIVGPVDIEGHGLFNQQTGTTDYYLCDFARLFPPDKVDNAFAQSNLLRNRHLFQLLRYEYLVAHSDASPPTPLSSDAFFKGAITPLPGAVFWKQHHLRKSVVELLAAGKRLRDVTCVYVAKKLDQVYVHRNAMNGYVISDISNVSHAYGVNNRLIGWLRSNSKSAFVRTTLLRDGLVRTLKNELRHLFRITLERHNYDNEFKLCILQYLQKVFGSTEDSIAYRSDELKTVLLKRYEKLLDKEESRVDKQLFIDIYADSKVVLAGLSECLNIGFSASVYSAVESLKFEQYGITTSDILYIKPAVTSLDIINAARAESLFDYTKQLIVKECPLVYRYIRSEQDLVAVSIRLFPNVTKNQILYQNACLYLLPYQELCVDESSFNWFSSKSSKHQSKLSKSTSITPSKVSGKYGEYGFSKRDISPIVLQKLSDTLVVFRSALKTTPSNLKLRCMYSELLLFEGTLCFDIDILYMVYENIEIILDLDLLYIDAIYLLMKLCNTLIRISQLVINELMLVHRMLIPKNKNRISMICQVLQFTSTSSDLLNDYCICFKKSASDDRPIKAINACLIYSKLLKENFQKQTLRLKRWNLAIKTHDRYYVSCHLIDLFYFVGLALSFFIFHYGYINNQDGLRISSTLDRTASACILVASSIAVVFTVNVLRYILYRVSLRGDKIIICGLKKSHFITLLWVVLVIPAYVFIALMYTGLLSFNDRVQLFNAINFLSITFILVIPYIFYIFLLVLKFRISREENTCYSSCTVTSFDVATLLNLVQAVRRISE